MSGMAESMTPSSIPNTKPRNQAFLHKQDFNPAIQDSLIGVFDPETLDVPQWLIYNWLLPNNPQLTDRRAITGFCEVSVTGDF